MSKDGGVGFRKLQNVNLALVAKQGWAGGVSYQILIL